MRRESRTVNTAIRLHKEQDRMLAAISYKTIGCAHSRTSRTIGIAWGPRITRPPVENSPPDRAQSENSFTLER